MAIHLLSAQAVRAAKAGNKPYQLRDGGSLFLSIQPCGSKLWRYRYRMRGRAQVYAIGRYPDVTLAQARQERDRARKLVVQGIHPISTRRAVSSAHTRTFMDQARDWLASNAQWSPAYQRQICRYLERDVHPMIGRTAVIAVSATDVRAIVESVADRGARCAALLIRQWISQILAHAVAYGVRDDNPAIALKGLVRRTPVRHHPPLNWSEIPAFMHSLNQWPGYAKTAIGLRLLALTFVRPSELRLARWDEFDLKSLLWTIPKERMKMRRSHMVPLSRQAVSLLRGLQTDATKSPWVLHGLRRPDKPLAASSFNRALDSLGYHGRLSAHGFRATATTLLGLLGYPDKLVDLQLAHRQRDASRSPYDHARFIASRTLLMQDWADVLDALTMGNDLARITDAFGPLSRRRTQLLRVCERE